MSPNGQFVVAGGVTWINDCLIWDTLLNKTDLQQLGCNTIQFVGETTFLGCVSGVGVEGSIISQFLIDDGLGITVTRVAEIPGEDLGHGVYNSCFGCNEGQINIVSKLGIATVTYANKMLYGSNHTVQRFMSILGSSDQKIVRPLFVSNSGEFVILGADNSLTILRRTSRDSVQGWFEKGCASALSDLNLYTVGIDRKSIKVVATPFDVLSPSRKIVLPRPEVPSDGWNTIVCGRHGLLINDLAIMWYR